MKLIFRILLISLSPVIFLSCTTVRNSSSQLNEDELFITRKYIGNFIDYSHLPPASFGSPHIIRIRTSLYNIYGFISAYSKKCDFKHDDRIYVRRRFYSNGLFGNWIYEVENDFYVNYRISEFQYEDKLLVQSWY